MDTQVDTSAAVGIVGGKEVDKAEFLKSGCCVRLETGVWGARRRIPKEKIKLNPGYDEDGNPVTPATDEQENGRKRMYRAWKDLVDRDHLRQMENLRGKAWRTIYTYSVGINIEGVAFVPREFISELDDKLKEIQSEFNVHVSRFLSEYEDYISEARQPDKLGPLFNIHDYPDRDVLETKFKFTWSFFIFNMPDQGADVLPPEKYREAEERFNKMIDDICSDATVSLRKQFLKLLRNLTDKLTGPVPKRFRRSNIDNLVKFIGNFKHLNIANDAELERILTDTQKLVDGVDPEDLKKDDAFRAGMATDMMRIEEAVTNLIEDVSVRKLLI